MEYSGEKKVKITKNIVISMLELLHLLYSVATYTGHTEYIFHSTWEKNNLRSFI